jgi:hypothetical protein
VIGKLYKAFDVPVYATLKGVSILLMIWLVDYCLTSQVIYGKRDLLKQNVSLPVFLVTANQV